MAESENTENTETPTTETPVEATADACYEQLTLIVTWLKVLDEKISSISTKIV